MHHHIHRKMHGFWVFLIMLSFMMTALCGIYKFLALTAMHYQERLS